MNDIGPMSSDGVFAVVSQIIPNLPPRIRTLDLHLEVGRPAVVTITHVPDVDGSKAAAVRGFYLVGVEEVERSQEAPDA